MATKRDLIKSSTKEQLAERILELEAQAKSEATRTPKEVTEAKTRSETVRTATNGLTPEKVAQDLATTSVKLTTALATVNEEFVNTTRQLAEAREAVIEEKRALEELHGKDTIATALDRMLLEYRQAEAEEKQKFADFAANLSTQRKNAQAAWTADNAERQKTRERDEEDYRFQREQTAKNDTFEYEQMKKARLAAEADRQREVERSVQDRLKAVADKEKEYTIAIETAKTFPAQLEQAIAKAAQEARAAEGARFGFEKRAMENNHSATIQVKDGQIATLTTQLTRAESEVDNLRKQLAEAEQRAFETAKAAMVEAGASKALAEVRTAFAPRSDNGQGSPARRQ